MHHNFHINMKQNYFQHWHWSKWAYLEWFLKDHATLKTRVMIWQIKKLVISSFLILLFHSITILTIFLANKCGKALKRLLLKCKKKNHKRFQHECGHVYQIRKKMKKNYLIDLAYFIEFQQVFVCVSWIKEAKRRLLWTQQFILIIYWTRPQWFTFVNSSFFQFKFCWN